MILLEPQCEEFKKHQLELWHHYLQIFLLEMDDLAVSLAQCSSKRQFHTLLHSVAHLFHLK